ncbi:MAG: outer membrane beta-barrel protein [Helicobacteraceae bacterium]|nr:outer membrane beta-barrel protein [Helicobacteraceae bacterium]
MKKVLTMLALGTILLSSTLQADEVTTSPLKPEGFYLGLGGGVTFNLTLLTQGYYQDDTTTYKSGDLSDADIGYIVYAGYQFNKIIAVEAAYTDYGSFSDTVQKAYTPGNVTFESDPSSVSVYANAGYTFSNGLRPFGQIGLGYLMVNGSRATDAIGIDDSMSMRFGLGVEYALENLSGFGFRAAYIEELAMDFSYNADDNGNDTSTLLMNIDGMLYLGAQYKF